MRECELLKKIDYKQLVKKNIIPDLFKYTDRIQKNKNKKVQYPIWVYNQECFTSFEIYINYMIRKIIHSNISETSLVDFLNCEKILKKTKCQKLYEDYCNKNKCWNSIAYETYFQIFESRNEKIISKEEFEKTYELLSSMCRFIQKSFEKCHNSGIKFNVEYKYGNISGRPDIINNSFILNIKSTDDFLKIAERSFLQLLIYATLSFAVGNKKNYIGILLPIQQDLILFNITNWNPSPFLKYLTKLCPTKIYLNIISSVNFFDNVGKHLKYNGSMTETIERYALDCINKYGRCLPCQMMIRKYNGKLNIKSAEIQEANTIINEYNIPYYTHSIFSINLSHPYTQYNQTSDVWILDLLRGDLKITSEIGGKGVVVHVGKSKHSSSIVEALREMEKSIKKVLPFATEECPLLLETPAGQGTETCVSFQEFSQFYSKFKDYPNFKVCIDTCHVFAAGHDPYEYLIKWNECHPSSIGLIHFNDSKKPKSSCVDRHEYPGNGHIGTDILNKIYKFSIKNKIPMVYE